MLMTWPKKRSEPPRRAPRRPWGPQAVGVLVLLLSFLIIYHGAEGTTLLRDLDAYLAGSKPVMTQAPATPAGEVKTDLDGVAALVPTHHWSAAGAKVAAAEGAWQKLEATYAKKGVSPTDLNGLTGDLAELQMAIAAKDATDAMAQVKNARQTFSYMEAVVAQGASPSLTEMSALVADLQKALASGNLSQAKDDAASLSSMLSTIQKGF